MAVSKSLASNLPFLRRYARALTGSQTSGDAYVRAVLTALLEGDQPFVDGVSSSRVGLYRLFHVIWSGTAGSLDEAPGTSSLTSDVWLHSLAAKNRAALLLTAVEAFTVDEAALILGLSSNELEHAIGDAHSTFDASLASKVLIIEDEPLIALDLESIVVKLGHQVVATAQSRDAAVAQARLHRPGIVLADINLGEGGSGIDAVSEILKSFDIPIIFITAYPEKLLTGERPEPIYLISKPFQPETVQATVSLALLFHEAERKVA